MRKELPFSLEEARAYTEIYPTPMLIYDEQGIRETVANVQQAFAWNKGFREYFAVKAAPVPAILRLLKSLGCGTDCASVTELELSRRSGIVGEWIVLSSNETEPEEYVHAAKLGGIINLDDLTQVDQMDAALREEGLPIPDTICCRYNPGQFAMSNAIMGHLFDSKYGMMKEQLLEAYRKLKELGVKKFGLHAFLQSCSLDETYYPKLCEELFPLALEIREKTGITLSFIDLSGGIGIPYRPEEKPVDILRIGEKVHELYDRILKAAGMEPALCTEMGRYITGPHGYLLTKVVGLKHIYKEYVGVDASACDMMRPAMYGAYHEIRVLGKIPSEDDPVVDVVGQLCENNDKFAIDRKLPKVEIGDLLVIGDSGAHGRSMGYNYNGRTRCGEYLLQKDGKLKQIRRPEELKDLFATFDIDQEFQQKR
ncbi:MAG: diaminopimelate decarboxylase [Firmicutes bacterium]|nr:diaminopimelate decarboxylase [Bacillota bacterium]